jgi:hypothetical protein
MAKQTFTAGQVLTAAQVNGLQTNDFNLTVSTKTAAYTFVVGDRGTRVVLNDTTARTFTIDDSIFSAGDTIQVHNINTGVLTIAAGAGVTLNGADVLTLAQWQGGTIYFTSASSAIFFPTAKTIPDSGLTLISSTTIGSAVSSVTVSSAFSATYDNYKITIAGGASTTGASLSLQLGATATGYYMVSTRSNYATPGTFAGVGDNNAAQWSFAGNASASGVYMNVELNSPNLAKRTYLAGWETGAAGGAGISGFLDNSTSYTAFTITTSTGTLTGGTIRVYGYKN